MPEEEIPAALVTQQARDIRTLGPKSFGDLQGELLEFLVKRKLDGLYAAELPIVSGEEILKTFYASKGRDPENAAAGRRLVGKLRSALFDYYAHRSDRLVIQIPSGDQENYKPHWFYRGEDFYKGSSVSANQDDFKYLGTNTEAMEYLADQVPFLKRLEDTTVRWDRKESLYTAAGFQRFLNALRDNRGLIFRSITSPVADKAYVEGLAEVFAKKAYPYVQCFRLHHAMPMMNFATLYFLKDDAMEVLFGYGIQTTYTDVAQTAVFRSRNRRLALEFQSLFRVFRNDRFSRPINVTASDFQNSAVYWCDVLATFPSFPTAELTRRFEVARKIIICVTAWHLLERSFYLQVEAALQRGCIVQIALWHPDSDFIKMRDEAIKGRPGYTVAERKMNGDTLDMLAKSHEALEVLEIDQGQASVTLFWIDDLIYFSPYWVGQNASDGTHFLVHATSKTGRRLQRQFHHMVGTPSETSKPIEAEEDD